MRLVDIGVNLANNQFRSDLPQVIERARTAGVERMVVTGTTIGVSERAAALCEEHAGLSSTAGVHPHHASDCDAAALARLCELAALPCVVALGECGLDYDRNFSPPEHQRRAFAEQLALATELDLPLFLHERAAHADMLAMLEEIWPALPRGAVVHCFTAGRAEAEAYLALGAHLGITGWISDERRGDALRAALPHLPQERLLFETDAPYLLPRDLEPRPASRRNEPCHLPHVLRAAARLTGTPPEDLARIAWRTAATFFGW